jgi:hypothetical protein
MSGRDINLDGTEVTIIKALGFGSNDVSGEDLIALTAELPEAELIDSLKGLMSLGYVTADKTGFYKKEDMEKVFFRINSGYSKDLKEALNPKPEKAKSKRVRRE